MMSWLSAHTFELGILLVLLVVVGLLGLIICIILYPHVKSYVSGERTKRKKQEELHAKHEEQKKEDAILEEVFTPEEPVDHVAEKVKKNLQRRREQEQRYKEETQSINPPLKTKKGDVKSTPIFEAGDAGAPVIQGDRPIGIATAGVVTELDGEIFQATVAKVAVEKKTLDEVLED